MSSNSPSSSPPSKDDSSPPPSDDNSSSPPPPPDDNSSSSPPPPSEGGSSSPPPSNSSPPPPSDNNNNNGGDNNNNGNNNNNDNNNNGNDNNNNNNGGSNNNNNNGSGDNNNKKSPPPPSSPNKNSNGPPPPPPPPPPRPPRHGKALAPPQTSDDSPSGDKGSDINTKALIGGVAGGAALLLVFMILCMVCCCRKKKRKSHDQMHYYRDNSHGNKTDYYNSGQHGNWVNQQSNDYHLKMPQPGSTAVSSEHGWAVPPPPPPPMTSSSELSSAAFSGPHGPALPPPHPSLALGFNKSTFSYDDLAAATGGFAKTNLLGQGGFGFVHKGVLPNGKEIAVKSLKSGSGQGEREFQAEVDIISRVHHRHLVSLVGYCIAGNQRMLVYEFVANDTLEHHLHGGGKVMDWPSRIRIALGSAKGFAYLHEDCHPRIIHRDIKASNILLDDHFEAKVADFGLAKLSNDNYTHVSTRIMGTFGYLAPEYASSGKLTEKSDVYSYGVMLLELITGRRPVDVTRDDDDTLIDWARPILMRAVEGGDYDELVDPRLENNYDPDEMLRMVACAASCIRHSARRRPKMSQIVRALEGDVSLEDLNEGTKPGHSALYGSSGSGSSEYDGSYNVDMKKFRKAGLSSQEFTSSEHGVTGEYAHSSGSESQEIRSNRSRMHSP